MQSLAAQIPAVGEPRPGYLPCSAEQVRAIADRGPGAVGAHTISHPELATLDPAEQYAELTGSRAALERLLNRRVTLFSYPFGHAHSFTDETVRLVRATGFSAACVNWAGAVDARVDPMRVPRLYVRDCEASVLRGAIDGHLGAAF
jgi:peptidoglycan/xylan/chitin deacetylase (PgdA/CDA1 family)